MTQRETVILDGWAAAEGWNPGLNDLSLVWKIQPQAFIALRHKGELIAGGSVLAYGASSTERLGQSGFMGLFIVHKDYRSRGLGSLLWQHRLEILRQRLLPASPIGMDGVLEMVPFYQRGGFVFSHNDCRYEGLAKSDSNFSAGFLSHVQALDQVPFALLLDFDTRHTAGARETFLRAWTDQPGAIALADYRDQQLGGYAMLRPCRKGYKIGPFFAESPAIAEKLLFALMARIPGQPMAIDIPECNSAALALAEHAGLHRTFACAKMYHGAMPELPLHQVFGVASFEFG
jgi:GNAT superfamily N-acetyltransferase